MILSHKTFIKDVKLPWITFIHGAGGSSTIWYKQLKFLKPHFNLLLIDLRGHGMSNKMPIIKNYSLDKVNKEILDVLDHLKISKTHFMGVSLGCILIGKLQEKFYERIDKIVMCGAITRFSIKTNFLLWLAQNIKNFTPIMWLYRIFALIIMPYPSHRFSRNIFINEAKKIKPKVFRNWLKLLPQVKQVVKYYYNFTVKNPTLFISGSQDYLFIEEVKDYVESTDLCSLSIVKNAGHIANIDQSTYFNQQTLKFLK